MKVIFDGKESLEVGKTSIVFSGRGLKAGEKVSFFSRMGNSIGVKPVAHGSVVQACKDMKGAPVTPTKSGKKKKNAWRFLYQIIVEEIE